MRAWTAIPALLAAAFTLTSVTPAEAVPTPPLPGVHSTIYLIRMNITNRPTMTPTAYNTVAATTRTAARWWGTQTGGRITFTVAPQTCTATTTIAADQAWTLQSRTIREAAAACGIPDTPLNIPTAVFTRQHDPYAAKTAMSHTEPLTTPNPTTPDYTRRTTAATMFLPTTVTAPAIEHELGHVLGLSHAVSLHPHNAGPTTNLDFRWESYTTDDVCDYGERNDIMGLAGRTLTDPTRALLNLPAQPTLRTIPPLRHPTTFDVSHGRTLQWEDHTGPGSGLDTFYYSINQEGAAQLVRLQRTPFTTPTGATFWTRTLYSLDPGTDAIAHLMTGTTYTVGDYHITPLRGSKVRIEN